MKEKPKIGDKVETKYSTSLRIGLEYIPLPVGTMGTILSEDLSDFPKGGVYVVDFQGYGETRFHYSNIDKYIIPYRVWKRREHNERKIHQD